MAENIKIGKDVIESLTYGMYDDSRFVFREYIQNAADQIDKAVESGLIGSRRQGNIFITINTIDKSIIIEDNATGIVSTDVHRILGNIALSEKDRDKDKGFRGIGRLGGLAYCDVLKFETSYLNETIKSVMVWDSKTLKNIINDRSLKLEATEVIENITELNTTAEDNDEHYFKVILEGVNNEELLNIKNVRDYLSMVAPLPFDNRFIYKDKIKDYFFSNYHYDLDEYNIFVNQEEIYKAYTTSIYEQSNGNLKKIDEVFDVKFLEINDEAGNQIAIGWYGLSTAINQIPKINLSRGFRLRKGNIQIGLDDTLRRFHKDGRFHYYYFGEIYAISNRLIPNARRDYFLENEICKHFEVGIKQFFTSIIHKFTYDASAINSAQKKIEKYQLATAEYKNKIVDGFTTNDEKIVLETTLEKKKSEAENAAQTLKKYKEKGEENDTLKKLIEKVVRDEEIIDIAVEAGNHKTVFRTDKLSKLNKHERKFISRVFTIIKQVLTPDLAENLIKKIEEDFK